MKKLDKKIDVYKKLFEGLDLNYYNIKSICDISLNTIDFNTFINNEIECKSFTDNFNNDFLNEPLSKLLGNKKFDLIYSICGSFYLNPLYESIQQIFKSLNVGGKFLFVLYPNIYDERGNNILNSLSLISEKVVYAKLNRWKSTVYNALSNLFINIQENEITQHVTFYDMKTIFEDKNFSNFLFDDIEEVDEFFRPLENEKSKKYTAFWEVITGLKI